MSITVNGNPEPLPNPSTLSEVVTRHLAVPGNPGNPGNPANLGNPANPGNPGVDGSDADTTGAGAAAVSAGIAVARNGTVVPRSRLAVTAVEAGDQIEIVTAVQGG